jgi:hypothetical protein
MLGAPHFTRAFARLGEQVDIEPARLCTTEGKAIRGGLWKLILLELLEPS